MKDLETDFRGRKYFLSVVLNSCYMKERKTDLGNVAKVYRFKIYLIICEQVLGRKF